MRRVSALLFAVLAFGLLSSCSPRRYSQPTYAPGGTVAPPPASSAPVAPAQSGAGRA